MLSKTSVPSNSRSKRKPTRAHSWPDGVAAAAGYPRYHRFIARLLHCDHWDKRKDGVENEVPNTMKRFAGEGYLPLLKRRRSRSGKGKAQRRSAQAQRERLGKPIAPRDRGRAPERGLCSFSRELARSSPFSEVG